MCRLTALPPFTTRKEAIRLLLEFQGEKNRDGVGSVHLDVATGAFVVVRYPTSLSSVLRNSEPFLTHLPHPGWTIVHLRAASHGEITVENTHPFITSDGSMCVAHNGIWNDHGLARLIISAAKGITFKGETDSEVAAEFLALVGPTPFMDELTFGGVYMALKLDGSLLIVKNSGALELVERPTRKDKTRTEILFASTLDWKVYPDRREVPPGIYHLGADSSILSKEVKLFKGRHRAYDPELDGGGPMTEAEAMAWAYGSEEAYLRGARDTDPDTGLPISKVTAMVTANPPLIHATEAGVNAKTYDNDETTFREEFVKPFIHANGPSIHRPRNPRVGQHITTVRPGGKVLGGTRVYSGTQIPRTDGD